MKKFVIVLCFMLCLGSLCFAASEDVTVLINKQVKVSYNDEIQEFQNVNGVRVYPISYEGTTYLPIRAISSLFGTEIKWDGETNSVLLGEGELDTTSAKVAEEFVSGENEEVTVLRNEDISIYFSGDKQTFTDVTGKEVYPLSYEGTTYLPVRAVSNLFGLSIDWDGEANAVLISTLSEENVSGEVAINEDVSGEAVINEDASSDDVIDVELGEKEEAIVIDNETYSFVDENGTNIYYYFTDDGEVYYYYFDEDDNFISYYYDENGELIYLYFE